MTPAGWLCSQHEDSTYGMHLHICGVYYWMTRCSSFSRTHSVLIHLWDALYMSWFQMPILQKYKSSNIFKYIPRGPTHTWNNHWLTELWACKSVTLTLLFWLPWQRGSCKRCLIVITYSSSSCHLPTSRTSTAWFVKKTRGGGGGHFPQ